VLEVGANWKSRAAWRDAIRWWRFIRPLLGIPILIAIVAPWLYLVQQRAPGLLSRMIGHDVIDRARTGLEGHSFPPGFYLLTIFGTFFPWSLLLPMALTIAWRSRSRPEIRFALAAVIGPWIMMELISTKLVHYVLPIFPPLAFLVADSAIQCFERKYNDLVSKSASFGGLLWGLIFAILGSLPWLATRHFTDLPFAAMLALTAIGLFIGILVYLLFRSGRPSHSLALMGAGFMAFCLVLFGAYLPSASFLRLSPRLASTLISQGATKPHDVRMLGYKEQSLAFYQGGTIDEDADNLLIKSEVENWPTWMVLTSDLYDALPAERRSQLEIIDDVRGINYAKGIKVLRVLVARKK
jgi:4-amino-4-deoxy-L-arabinose transferase-like glycosyltransferase